MVTIDGEKFACMTCIRGHRVSKCRHTDVPLKKINRKGRPFSSCNHCDNSRNRRGATIVCGCSTLGIECKCASSTTCLCLSKVKEKESHDFYAYKLSNDKLFSPVGSVTSVPSLVEDQYAICEISPPDSMAASPCDDTLNRYYSSMPGSSYQQETLLESELEPFFGSAPLYQEEYYTLGNPSMRKDHVDPFAATTTTDVFNDVLTQPTEKDEWLYSPPPRCISPMFSLY